MLRDAGRTVQPQRQPLDVLPRHHSRAGRRPGRVAQRILDGEIVVLDKRARPSFDLVQRRLRCESTADLSDGGAASPVCRVLHVLHLDGIDVTGRPYLQRRELLRGLQLDAAPVITSPYLSVL